MRVFVTGATGFIGTVVVRDLIKAGHKVLGLVRSDAGAAPARRCRGRGSPRRSRRPRQPAEGRGVIGRGDPPRLHPRLLAIPGGLRGGQEVWAIRRDERRGSPAPTARWSSPPGPGWGRWCRVNLPRKTTSIPTTRTPEPPRKLPSEAASRLVACGVTVVRLPQVLLTRRNRGSAVPPRCAVAREKGLAAYVGEGLNRWPAVHVLDVARLVYRLAAREGGRTGAQVSRGRGRGRPRPERSRRRSGGACESQSSRCLPRGLPVISAGWRCSPGWTCRRQALLTRQQRLGWRPTQKAGMIDDLDHMDWSQRS